MNEKEFINSLKECGILLDDHQIDLLNKYCDFLLEYNKTTNLTAIRERNDVFLKHFYDSIILGKFHQLSNETVLDIGAGAGFPGVPLKIVFPDIKLTELDSNGKKTKFLEELRKELDIKFEVVNDRAEKYNVGRRESFDMVTGRAVTSMPVLAELCIPFVKLGGNFIAYKGNIDETLENGEFAIQELGGSLSNIYTYRLPRENSIRTLLIINKEKNTPDIYPRNFDKISKKPLQKK